MNPVIHPTTRDIERKLIPKLQTVNPVICPTIHGWCGRRLMDGVGVDWMDGGRDIPGRMQNDAALFQYDST